MLGSTNSGTFINFINVLKNPSNVVPTLADEEVYTIIVDSIRAYLEQEIDLKTFIDIATKIKLFSGIKKNTNEDIDKTLIMLTELSKYLNSKEKNSEEINATLIEALDILSNK